MSRLWYEAKQQLTYRRIESNQGHTVILQVFFLFIVSNF